MTKLRLVLAAMVAFLLPALPASAQQRSAHEVRCWNTHVGRGITYATGAPYAAFVACRDGGSAVTKPGRLRTSSYARDRQDPTLARCWQQNVGDNFDTRPTSAQRRAYVRCAAESGLQPR